MKDHGKIYKVNSHSQSSNKDIKISGKNKHRKLVAKRPEKQEFLDIEKDEEEEQIQLALLISLEELNKNKKPKKKEEIFKFNSIKKSYKDLIIIKEVKFFFKFIKVIFISNFFVFSEVFLFFLYIQDLHQAY